MNEERNYKGQTSLAGGGIPEGEEQKIHTAEMKKKYRLISLILVAVIAIAVVLLIANLNGNSPVDTQGNGNSSVNKPTEEQPALPAELTISQSTLQFDRVGDFATLTANKTGVTWSTNEPNIVSVSDTGVVTALNGGTAKIYAEHEDTIKVCTVTVNTYVPTEDEIAEAKRQLRIIEDYEAQYTTYSYAEIQSFYNEFAEAGNTGSTFKRTENVEIVYSNHGWYCDFTAYYSDASGKLIYMDEYTLVVDGSFHTGRPPFSRWVTSSVYNQIFSIQTDKGRYHCYHNGTGAFSWLLYGADYIDDIASRTIILAEYLG